MRTGMSFLFATALAAAGLSAQPQLLIPLSQPTQSRGPSGRLTLERPNTKTAAQQQARAFRSTQLRGRKLSKAVNKVTKQLNWHSKLDRALEAAAETSKPVLWINALGKLKGYT